MAGFRSAAKAKIAQDLKEAVWPLIASGRGVPVMDQEFDLAEAADAHRRMEGSTHVGKIVMTVGG